MTPIQDHEQQHNVLKKVSRDVGAVARRKSQLVLPRHHRAEVYSPKIATCARKKRQPTRTSSTKCAKKTSAPSGCSPCRPPTRCRPRSCRRWRCRNWSPVNKKGGGGGHKTS